MPKKSDDTAKKPVEKSKKKSGKNSQQILTSYVKAGYPLIYMLTPEEQRAEADILETAKSLKRSLWQWSVTEGLVKVIGGKDDDGDESLEDIDDPVEMLTKIRSLNKKSIFILRDMHDYFNSPIIKRHLRDIARDFKQLQKTVVLLGPVRNIPNELERDLVLVEFDFPKVEQLGEIFDTLWQNQEKTCKENGKKNPLGKVDANEKDRISQAAMGLTTDEAESAFAKAMVVRAQALRQDEDEAPLISEIVMEEKAATVKKTGILEYFDAGVTTADIGGLEVLKKWMATRSHAFSKEAREFGLPMPRGILLVGLPGCGKSLTAKAAASILGVPLIRFDIGRVFGGLVGQSEENMRKAIQTVEAIGQCVVWIDEMEKAFAGMGSSGATDSGVTSRVFGSFITWMQEKKTPSFIVATVNRIENTLPPEMLRKGRFDEIFFVNLPGIAERIEILKIHIKKFKRDPENFNLENLAKLAGRFSGAELEEAVVSALYAAFDSKQSGGGDELTQEAIELAITSTTPLAVSKKDDLEKMSTWAQDNAVDASVSKTKVKKLHKKGQDKEEGGREMELE